MFFWGLLASTFIGFAADDACLNAIEIQSAIEDFKIRAQPLMSTFLLPTEIVYNDVPLLKEEHITAFTYIKANKNIHVGVAGQKCLGTFAKDELDLILCHEMGHIAGGHPFMNFIGHDPNVISAEGQADFFTTSSCLPAVFKGDDNLSQLEKIKTHPELAELCPQSDDQERGLCVRVMMASLRFIHFIHLTPNTEKIPHSQEEQGPLPTLLGKDERVVNKTLLREYPSTQCRLQTLIAGFQCQAKNLFSNYTANPQTEMSCGDSAELAPRPLCWYKPQ